MDDRLLAHVAIEGIVHYRSALDVLCKKAQRALFLFEKDFDGLGYNSEAMFATLHRFLLASPINRLFVLAHDTCYLSTRCPRMLMLLHQFGTSMFIHQTPKHLRHISQGFSVADGEHCIRRFHVDQPQGVLAIHDPEQAILLRCRFMDMWATSLPCPETARLKV